MSRRTTRAERRRQARQRSATSKQSLLIECDAQLGDVATGTWAINDNSNMADYYESFGDALSSIARNLDGLKEGLDENLRWVAESISVPIYKVLVGGDHPPLLNCVKRPSLPPLLRPDQLVGDPYELFNFEWSIGPSDKPETGTYAEFLGYVFPLYGLQYRAQRGRFLFCSPWDIQSLPLRLAPWMKQSLVELSRTTQTIHDVVSDVRNQRGAHTDKNWTMRLPQPLRQFYWVYANLFMVQVGHYLVQEAFRAIRDDEFASAAFPRSHNLTRLLQYSLPRRSVLTIDRIRPGNFSGKIASEMIQGNSIDIPVSGGGGAPFELIFSEGIVIRHISDNGPGTIYESTHLWDIRAPMKVKGTIRPRMGLVNCSYEPS